VNARARTLLFLASGALAAALLLWGTAGLPGFGRYPGPYGDIINAVALSERHVTNLPTAVIFDYRGFDTLGEEYILFTSVTILSVILRKREGPPEPSGAWGGFSEPIAWAGWLLSGVTGVFGLYTILHGQLTPGGGFHGGVILASLFLLIFLAYEARVFLRIFPKTALEALEALGAGGYVLVGLAPLLSGRGFLTNVLPLGQLGDIRAGGTIALINAFVGVEVAAAFALLVTEFIAEIEQKEARP